MTSPLLRKPLTILWRTPVSPDCLALALAIIALTGMAAADEPTEAAPSQSTAQQYQRQLDMRINGFRDWFSFKDAGAFWARENARVAYSGSMLLNEPISEIIEPHLLEIPPPPAVDVYDQKPIIATASFETVADETPQEQLGSQTSSRLKTDIRSIQPSLSYALKDIPAEQLPKDFAKGLNAGEYEPRETPATVLQWAPTNFYHYPLYFEDPALERYGHTYHRVLQPFVSTTRFAGQLVGLPYQMAIHPVNSRQYSLGHYRPGEYAPKKLYQIPFNEEAVVMEAAVLAGLILILP